ncbi:hypothetical protein pb186bvf_012920 [Paramecium bursaria]
MDAQNSAAKDDQSLQQRGKRRGRSDQNNRDYFCGCGKSYLSYPALYTHLKQKHDSKPPDGTLLPNNTAQRTGRGRPKKVFIILQTLNMQLDENDPKSVKSDDEKSAYSNEPEETLEDMLVFLDSLGSFRQGEKFNTEEEKQKYLLKNFPKEYFSNNNDFQSIMDHIKEITTEKIKNPTEDPINKEEIDHVKNIKKTCINKILAYFLVYLGPKINVDAYKEIATFTIFFARSLNQLGYQAQQAYESGDAEQQNQIIKVESTSQYCEEQNGEQILLTANEFILQMLPEFYQQLGQDKKTQIFGSQPEKLKNAVYITQHLSYWFYSQKFTNCRLALYTDDE